MNKYFRWFTPGAQTALPAKKSGKAPEKKNANSPLIAFQANAFATWSAYDFQTLATEGFAKNPIGYRCIRLISETAASLPWQLFDSDRELDHHPILRLLAQPNFRYAGQEFMEALYGHLLISGNAYIRSICLNDVPRELHLLRPDRMRTLVDSNGWPSAYIHTNQVKNERYDIGSDNSCQILHLKLYNPLDEDCGLAPLRAAHLALDIHNAASTWNKALLDNSARPSGAMVYSSSENPNLSEEQFARLKQELEDGYSGATRAGRPMLLEGGLDWKAMGYSPRDMDFIDAKNGASRDIALAFGVPPMLLGIPGDNTYSNYKEANKAFWHQTVLPMISRTSGAIGNWSGLQFGDEIKLGVDHDQVEALAVDRTALWNRIQSADFLTENEKREAVGFGPGEENANE